MEISKPWTVSEVAFRDRPAVALRARLASFIVVAGCLCLQVMTVVLMASPGGCRTLDIRVF